MQRTATSPPPNQPYPLLLTNSEVTPPLSALAPARQSSPALYRNGPIRLTAWGTGQAGALIEPAAKWALHGVGKGPDAITQNIEKIFDGDCESVLTDLHTFLNGTGTTSQHIRRLEKECRKLISFVDQQQTNATLLQTFQNIVVLTTRYPSLRRMFLHSANKTDSEMEREITALRMHDDDTPGHQWDLLKHFALVTMSRNRVTGIVESHAPSELALASHTEGFCAIEKLLGFCRDSELGLNSVGPGVGEALFRPLAVRFLAGILRRHPFWTLNQSRSPNKDQMLVAKKLCNSAVQLVEDMPMDINRDQRFKLDVVGLDVFLAVVLDGLHNWMLQLGWRRFRGCDDYEKLIKLLHHPNRNILFPSATERAIRFYPPDALTEVDITIEEEIEEELRTNANPPHDEGEAENNTREQIKADTRPSADPSPGEGEIEHNTQGEIKVDTRPNAEPPRVGARGIDKITGIRKDDIVIAFIGPTGNGKSYFIDLLTHQKGRRAGSGLRIRTTQIGATRITGHPIYGDRLVLVDTPGYTNLTLMSDPNALRMITDWLVKLYNDKRVKLSGIVYLHRITDNRLSPEGYETRRKLEEICRRNTINHHQIVLVLSFWEKIRLEAGVLRETELKERFWKSFIDNGSRVDRLRRGSPDDAWRIVNQLVQKRKEGNTLPLREDLEFRPNTRDESLRKLLSDQKEDLKKLLDQVETSRDPVLMKELQEEYAKAEAQLQKMSRSERMSEQKTSLSKRIAQVFVGRN